MRGVRKESMGGDEAPWSAGQELTGAGAPVGLCESERGRREEGWSQWVAVTR